MSGGGGMGSSSFTPSGIIDNWRAHPGQQLLSTGLGMLLPGAGTLAGMGFRAYNNHQFNNAAANSLANGAAQGDQAAQAGFDRPLNGPLGLVTGLPGSYGAPDFGGVSGAGGGMNFGGGLLDMLGSSQPTPALGEDGGMFVPDYSGAANAVPNSPMAGRSNNVGRDYRDGLALNVGVGNYGISPMQVGGQNVIFGSGDPNGRYRNRGVDYGG